MQIGATSFGAKIPLPKDTGFGITVANGALIQVRQGIITRVFVMSKPISFGKDGSFGGALFGTEWFKVKDPDKGIMIKDFHKKLAELDLSSTLGLAKVDVSLTIYDDLNQPWYTIEKVNVKNQGGFVTTGFKLRAELIQTKVVGSHEKTKVANCIKSH